MWREKYNNISKQLKADNSTITAKEWNQIVNVLKEQANNNTEGIKTFNDILVDTIEDRFTNDGPLHLVLLEAINNFLIEVDPIRQEFLDQINESVDLLVNTIQKIHFGNMVEPKIGDLFFDYGETTPILSYEEIVESLEEGSFSQLLLRRLADLELASALHASKTYVDSEIVNKTGITKAGGGSLNESQIYLFISSVSNGIYKIDSQQNGSELIFKTNILNTEQQSVLTYGRILANGKFYVFNFEEREWQLRDLTGPAGADGLPGINGNHGQNAINGNLIPDDCKVVSTVDGTGYDISTFEGIFKVYDGIEDVTSECTFNVTTPTKNGLTLTIDSQTGVYHLSGSVWTSFEENFEVTAQYGSTVLSRRFVAVKLKQGEQGIDPQYVEVSGPLLFKYLPGATVPTRTAITLSAHLYGDLTTYDWEYWTGTIWRDLSGIQNTSTYGLAHNAVEFGASDTLRIRCLSGTHYDEVTIIKLYDGAKGDAGLNGSHAYVHLAYANSVDGVTDFSTTVSTGKLYLGTLTDFELEDSQEPALYKWTLIKGAAGSDGADGRDGNNGLPAYIHYAYATSPDGSTGFSTSYVEGSTYLGILTDFNIADSTEPSDYEWSKYVGTDGVDGENGSNGTNAFLHLAYATESDGSAGFSRTYDGQIYMGTCSTSEVLDPSDPTIYTWNLIKGSDGTDGDNGLPSYTHIVYGTSILGADLNVSWFEGATYIGTMTDFNVADSTNPALYKWAKFQGEPGTDGADGISSFIHLAYANSADGTLDFSTSYATGRKYIGTYKDTTEADSTLASRYTWSRFKGEDGADGNDGTSVTLKGSVAEVVNLPASAAEGDLWVVLADGDGYVSDGAGNWSNVGAIRGPEGIAGSNGINAYFHRAFANTIDNSDGSFTTSKLATETFKYMGTVSNSTEEDPDEFNAYEWVKFTGDNGADGADGKSAYFHIAYCIDPLGTTMEAIGFTKVFVPGVVYIGTYTDDEPNDYTVESPADINLKYTWALFKGFDGADGADGTNGVSSYLHTAYADTPDGTGPTFKTSYYEGYKYLGTYVDTTPGDSSDPTKYKWTKFVAVDGADGANGINGTDGDDGLPGFLHYAYATASDGSVGFNLEYFPGAIYMGVCFDHNEEDPGAEDFALYDWALFKGDKGDTGEQGEKAYVHYAYANAIGTSNDDFVDFSTSEWEARIYMGVYSDNDDTDSETPTRYRWSLIKGANGLNALNLVMSNSNYTAPALYNGTGYVLSEAGGSVQMWNGVLNVTDETTLEVAVSEKHGLTFNLDPTTGIYILEGTNWTTDLESFEVTGTYSGVTLTQIYTISKSRGGEAGIGGVDASYILVTGEQTFKYTSGGETVDKESITLSAQLFGSLTNYRWQYYNGTAWADFSGAITGQTFVLSHTNAAWNGNTIRVRCLSGTLYDEITINKLYDGSNGDNVYMYLAYANTIDNSDSSFSTSSFAGAKYIGIYKDNVDANPETYGIYTWNLIKGEPGDGWYTYIAYATTVAGANLNTGAWAGEGYIGVYSGTATSAPQTASAYSWALFKGENGDQGFDGPGLLYRGVFNASNIYTRDNTRRDVVKYPDENGYYYAKVIKESFAKAWPTSNVVSEWEIAENFEFIATDLLLAQDVMIEKGLVMGSSATADADKIPFIRSSGMDSLTDGIGFYFEGSGKFRIGNVASDNIYWNNATLAIKGDITADNLTIGNNFNLGKVMTVAEGGVISTSGMTLSTGSGFYLQDDGQLRLGNTEGDNLYWDGNDLTIQGDIIAENLTINSNFNLGKVMTVSTGGVIRSSGMTSISVGSGFYMDTNGNFRLGNVSADNLYWNGSTLAIKGDITADNLTIGNDLTVTNDIIIGNDGEIHTVNKDSMTDTTPGVFIDSDGHFIFGTHGGNRVKWDGTNFEVVTQPYEIILDSMINNTDSERNTAYFTIKNNTASGLNLYVVCVGLDDSESRASIYVAANSEATKSYILADAVSYVYYLTNSTGSTPYTEKKYFSTPQRTVEFRESLGGLTDWLKVIQTSAPESNSISDNRVRMEYLSDGYVCPVIGSLSSIDYDLGDYYLDLDTVLVSVDATLNSTGGCDVFYVRLKSTESDSFYLTHDYANGTQNRYFYLRLGGYRSTH